MSWYKQAQHTQSLRLSLVYTLLLVWRALETLHVAGGSGEAASPPPSQKRTSFAVKKSPVQRLWRTIKFWKRQPERSKTPAKSPGLTKVQPKQAVCI